MKHRHLLALMQSGFTTIEVIFDGPTDFEVQRVGDMRARRLGQKTYTYKARLSDGIKEGDHVVVDSPSRGLTLVTVVAVHSTPKIDLDAPFTYKWIVQKVDRTAYDTTMEQEAEFAQAMLEVERVRQREVLLQEFTKHLPEDSKARAMFDNATRPLIEGDGK